MAQHWLPWQRRSRDRKGNFRSFIYSHSSTIRANSVKIGPGDAEITGLAEITKNIFKTSAKHKRAERVG